MPRTSTLTPLEIPTGRFVQAPSVALPGFTHHYPLTIYVPPGYDDDRQYYPVAYMLDGQNLFGDVGSYAGGWHVHEVLDKRAAQGKTVPLVVGIHNGGLSRMSDFSPWDIQHNKGRGEAFLTAVVDVILPLIQTEWRVLQGPQHTMLGGSSLGGLMALFGFFRFPEIFGRVLSMSPSVWVGDGEILRYAADLPHTDGARVYVDAGGREGRTMSGGLAMTALLTAKGYVDKQDMMWRPDARGAHNEPTWRRRLPKAMTYLYK
ncbi:MAG: alpha/beta hydrolase [Candidatus Sericytochromatia bacterium]|nr:alpha/beta hydrolase [Candidatus Sericytochromatia bacterium]